MKTLQEGQIVHVHGKEFIARNVRDNGVNKLGERVFVFNGECTENSCNDGIRNTMYNGATYSWRASDH